MLPPVDPTEQELRDEFERCLKSVLRGEGAIPPPTILNYPTVEALNRIAKLARETDSVPGDLINEARDQLERFLAGDPGPY